MNFARLRHDVAVVSQRWDQLPRILKPAVVVVLGCVAATSVYKEWRTERGSHEPMLRLKSITPLYLLPKNRYNKRNLTD